ncbi:MAG TPA: anthranilate phosphoribosyltransferase [Kofleriaceae bacterium]|jgi:anthranilate phosphoribosyltransferase|nr:anthranilate phosphoribosyltransferase [Kofleriaceae bacterium]
MSIVKAIAHALAHQHLGRAEMAEVIGQIMDGEATPAQIGGLLIALRAKGEAVDEIVGAAAAMRSRALPLECPRREHSIDTCGTGGDGAGTINVSTLAAILIAACGGVVAKHGNRALSSKCGSADVLEALGVAIEAEPAVITRCIEHAGIGFAFAPKFHTATRHVSGPRRELGTRTIFNLLGPLTNPANVRHQVVGVFDRRWCEHVAAALGALGLRRAAVVHGAGGIDEIAVRGETHVAIYDAGIVLSRTLTPRSFGIDEVDPAGLAGGDAAHNAGLLKKVLAGQHIGHGERLEAVLHASAMTAALGLELLEPGELDLARLPDQYMRAATVARDGAARLVLHRWCEASQAAPDTDLSELAARTADEFRGVE